MNVTLSPYERCINTLDRLPRQRRGDSPWAYDKHRVEVLQLLVREAQEPLIAALRKIDSTLNQESFEWEDVAGAVDDALAAYAPDAKEET